VASAALAEGGALQRRVAAESALMRQRAVLALGGAAAAGTALLLAAAALALGEARWLAWPRPLPVLVWGVVGAAVAVVAARGGRRLWARLAPAALAAPIEHEQGLRRGALVGALEVGHQGVLGAKGAADVARRLPPGTLLPVAGRQWGHRALGAAGALLLGALALWGARRAAPDGWAAVWHPWRAWRGTLLPALSVRNLPASVPRGMPLTLTLQAPGRRQLSATWQADGEPRRDTTLAVPPSGVVALAVGAVRAPLAVTLSDGRSAPLTLRLAVADRGWVGDLALRARFPAYLARPDEAIEPAPPLVVPRGTQLRVSAGLRGGLTRAGLARGTDTVWLTGPAAGAPQVAGVLAVSGTLPVDGDATWHWVAADGQGGGLPPELPDSLPISIIPDALPEVAIVGPMGDTTVGTVGVLPVRVLASDDHAVGRVWLEVRTERAAAVDAAARTASRAERLEVATPQDPAFDGGATLPLEGRNLEPGDRLLVVAVAEDASPWRQQARTTPRILRVPSLAEQREAARSLGDSLAARAAQLAAQEARLARGTAEAARNRDLAGAGRAEQGAQAGAQRNGAQPSPMRFSAAERAKQLAREQQQLGARVDSLRQGAKDLEQRLRSASAMDTALASRMRDIQRMLREAMTPEMQKALEQVNQSAERLSGTEAQQSLEQLARQQQQMREQLARSAEMLKRAALEGSMQTLRDDARDLAKAERDLADRLAGAGKGADKGGQKGAEKRAESAAGKPDGAAGERPAADREARQLADRTRAMEEAVKQLAKRLEEAGARPGAARTQAAEPRLNEAAQAMERAAREGAAERQERATPGQQAGAGDPTQSASMPGTQGNRPADQPQGVPSRTANQGTTAGAEPGKPGGQQPGGQQPGGQQAGGQPSGGQPSGGQQPGGRPSAGGAADQARRAADAMAQAAQQLAEAREAQVEAWKGDLSQSLDRSINETMQLARQQAALAEQAKQQGARATAGEQGALQQGVQQAAERLEQAARSSSLLSQRTQKAMAEAQRRVQQATQAAQQSGGGQPGGGGEAGSQQAQDAMKEAAEALNQALSSMVRDRERVNSAQSGSGFTEMVDQLRQLAQQQGQLNGQLQGLNLLSGGAKGQAAQQQVRVLARQQREVARTLSDVSDLDQTGRTDALAKEAQGLAQQLERNGLDASTVARQQQLYRRLLDAGRLMEQDDRDDQGPRESRTASPGGDRRPATGTAAGANALRFAPPTWNDLRGLPPDERRLVVDYFRRLNGGGPPR
jgi:hypothetical protein